MKNEDTKLTTIKTELIPQDEATMLIAQAIDKGTDVATMEKLLAMRTQLKAEKAKEAYDRAMAIFQGECPIVERTKQGYNYKYAPLEVIAEQIKPYLAKNGLYYTFNTEEKDTKILVCCTVTHVSGHSGTPSCATIAKEATTKMNASQQSGAQMTYGKRYSLMNALGITVRDEDNDAATIHQPTQQTPSLPNPSVTQEVSSKAVMYLTDKQKGMIQSQLKRLGKDRDWLEAGLKVRYGVSDYHNLSLADASKVIKGLLEMKDPQEEQPQVTDADMDDIASEASGVNYDEISYGK